MPPPTAFAKYLAAQLVSWLEVEDVWQSADRQDFIANQLRNVWNDRRKTDMRVAEAPTSVSIPSSKRFAGHQATAAAPVTTIVKAPQVLRSISICYFLTYACTCRSRRAKRGLCAYSQEASRSGTFWQSPAEGASSRRWWRSLTIIAAHCTPDLTTQSPTFFPRCRICAIRLACVYYRVGIDLICI